MPFLGIGHFTGRLRHLRNAVKKINEWLRRATLKGTASVGV
jgi:hypothetical protein